MGTPSSQTVADQGPAIPPIHHLAPGETKASQFFYIDKPEYLSEKEAKGTQVF